MMSLSKSKCQPLSSFFILGRGICLRVPSQVNRTGAGWVQICILGWLPSSLWTCEQERCPGGRALLSCSCLKQCWASYLQNVIYKILLFTFIWKHGYLTLHLCLWKEVRYWLHYLCIPFTKITTKVGLKKKIREKRKKMEACNIFLMENNWST